MKLNKLFALAGMLITLATASVFAKAKSNSSDNKIKVVATIFPEYDWAKEIIGSKADNVELTLLLNNGTDLHSYSPSFEDISKISKADIFIYVGGESDEWVDKVLKNANNPKIKVINLLETLGNRVKNEEVVEGMQHSHHHDDEHGHDEHDEHDHDDHDHDVHDDHDHDHDVHDDHDHDHDEHDNHDHDEHGHEGHHHHEDEKDEHVWLSLKNAKILSAAICDALCDVNPKDASAYKANLASYVAKLDSLDSKYSAAVKAGRINTLLFGDRFPFRYLVDDYGLKYFAAFTGCSAESEASFKTVVFLSQKMNELGLNYVLKIESGNGKIAKTIISTSKNKKAKVLTMDSMQSTTAKQIKKGETYLKAMERNLEVLKTALK